ncbi:MAG TPA: glycosyl transferase family 2, partial [Alphaproteobacteria bacterium]|nr:glycosyl transferase family 2 [Alphaproteobacteria bacterium]
MSYNFAPPEERETKADEKERLAKVDRQLGELSRVTGNIRLYASSGIMEPVAAIAREHGLSVIAGAWVGEDKDFSKRELDAVIRVANRNPNVRSIVIGNETILRKELKVHELIKMLRYVRRRVRVPVTTGETWDIWLAHPELVREVDYIAAHMLPYWEGIPSDYAATYAFKRYDELRRKFPGKRVVIAEFGWPSQGYNNRAAETGGLIQAQVLREFIAEANWRGVPYNVIEAFDQPWKANEGSVGAYWGLYDADGKPKFPLDGTVSQEYYPWRAGLGIVLGLIVTVFGLRRRRPTFL